MRKRATIVGLLLVLSMNVATSQTPSPDAMTVARKLVMTLNLPARYEALLPSILQTIKPLLTQERPEIERDYDSMAATVADAYTPHLDAMVEAVAVVYAKTFTVSELRDLEAFYLKPAGQKLLKMSPAIVQQTEQIGLDGSRKATDDLRARLTDLVRGGGKK